MSTSAPAPSVDPSLLFRRLNEVRPLPTVARLTTLMVLFLTLWSHGQTQTWVMALLAVLFSWLAFTLWFQTTGRVVARADGVFHGAVIPLMLICVHSTSYGGLLIPLVIHPLTVITLLHGLRLGLVLAGIGAAGLLVSPQPLGFSTQHLLPALGVLLIPLMANMAARPIAALRRRVALAAELERELDPRRGLQAVGLVVADRLRQATGAQRVIVFHRDAEVPTVLVADRDDSAYEASPALASRLLPVLAELPVTAMSLNVDSAPGSGLSSEAALAARQAVEPQMRQIAGLLEARTLQLVPDASGESRSGWLLVAYGQRAAADRSTEQSEPWPLSAVAAFAAEMRRLLQQASYVDTLQAEIAAHERARIGRDLHDSAVQPYLGLKFAIDVVAQRCTPDNPIHAQVQDLRQFCEAELNELRDTVAVLRTGTVRGDNSLVPALRRQAKRFATLFGIETTLDLPEELVVSRALSGAVLHMVNEALNNVRRHSKAKNVWVKVSRDERGMHLVIRDDAGQRTGFPTPHFTPRSLSERAQELGGTLEVSRHQGLDTEVRIHIPA